MADMLERSLLSALEDPAITAVLKRAKVDWLPYEQFLEMRMPATMSPRESWRVLQALRRAEAIEFPGGEEHGVRAWYVPTYRMLEILSEIDQAASSQSRIGAEIFNMNAPSRAALLRARAAEASASARLDGFEFASDVALRQLSPRSGVDRLAKNAAALAASLNDDIDRPFSMELAYEYRERLIQGVGAAVLRNAQASKLGSTGRSGQPAEPPADWGRSLASFWGYANGETGEPYEHHAIRAISIFNAFRVHHPLPDCNHIVARAFFGLYCRKHGLPVLGVLPFVSALSAAAESPDGGLDAWLAVPIETESGRTEFDCTGAVTATLRLLVEEIERLQSQIREAEARGGAILTSLAGDGRFNRRQRLLLGRALASPDWTFTIAAHKAIHEVTYATARKDLLSLAQSGYLVARPHGRAHAFVPAPDLAERLGVGASKKG